MTKDDDFIWLYSLMDEWDKTLYTHYAPYIVCNANQPPSPPPDSSGDFKLEKANITVFTCFPAVWESGDDSRSSSRAGGGIQRDRMVERIRGSRAKR